MYSRFWKKYNLQI